MTRDRSASGPADLVREEILALKAYHVAPASGMIKLDAMENPYRLPEPLREEVGRAVAALAINRYPDPEAPELKARLRESFEIPADAGLLIGNGSDEIIAILAQTLARPGAVMMYPGPTFVMYAMNATLTGMRPVATGLREDFSFDTGAFLAAMREHRPALVYIAYPNNPTGVLYPEDDVVAVLSAAEGLVVLDEAYHVFARKSFMSRLPEFPNLVVMRTVSKLGLAGIRLGYLAARPEWVTEFNKVRQAYNVNVLTQAAALFVLEHLDVLDVFPADGARERELVLRKGGDLVREK